MSPRDYTTRTADEAKALQLLDNDSEVSSVEMMVRNTFRAMWWASMPVRKITAISEAMSGFTVTSDTAVQTTLTRMVRKGILRSRVSDGTRFYEVNF